jgi:hypothetical protein
VIGIAVLAIPIWGDLRPGQAARITGCRGSPSPWSRPASSTSWCSAPSAPPRSRWHPPCWKATRTRPRMRSLPPDKQNPLA